MATFDWCCQVSGSSSLNPDEYEDAGGLDRLLEVLRKSPLQSLPVPDSFARLESWHSLRRYDRETIPELLVREEDLFVQLQQSLQRARADRVVQLGVTGSRAREFLQTDPQSTPSQSPLSGTAQRQQRAERRQEAETPEPEPRGATADFFEDEMRGYRLLKAARLSNSERQHVLTQTRNSTHFEQVRLALRTLFADDFTGFQRPRHLTQKIWWNEGEWEDVEWDSESHGYVHWNDGYENPDEYWNDEWEQPEAYLADYGWEESTQWTEDTEGSMVPNNESEDPEERQFAEAYNLASEANRTLQQAREAVKRVRQSRGYYSPESASGKGMTKSFSASKGGSPSSGSQKGSSKDGCFICGKPGHGYMSCPDRFSKGSGKGFMKGSSKGLKSSGKGKSKSKQKGKGKGKSLNYMEYPYWEHGAYVQTIAAQWDEWTMHSRPHTRVIIDTGATENAIGVDALSDLVLAGGFPYTVECGDLPVFRFGNGHRDQAKSRVDITGTSMGNISFYVLDGQGRSTPPLVGAKTLREKYSMLSYSSGLFMFEMNQNEKERTYGAIQMQALSSGHVTIDLAETPTILPSQVGQAFRELYAVGIETPEENKDDSSRVEHNVFMVQKIVPEFHGRPHLGPQCLASRLEDLRYRLSQLREDDSQGAHSMRRSKSLRIPMLCTTQGGSTTWQSTWGMDTMPEVRPEVVLHLKERDAWRFEGHGTRSSCDQVRDARARGQCDRFAGQQRHGQRQDHGSEREDATSWHQDSFGFEHDLCGVPQADCQEWSSRWIPGDKSHHTDGIAYHDADGVVTDSSYHNGDRAEGEHQETCQVNEPNSKGCSGDQEGPRGLQCGVLGSEGWIVHSGSQRLGGAEPEGRSRGEEVRDSLVRVKEGLRMLMMRREESGNSVQPCCDGETCPGDLCYSQKSLHGGTGIPYNSEVRSEERRVEGMDGMDDGLVRGLTTQCCDCTTKNSKPIKLFFQEAMDRHGHPDSFGKQANMWNTLPKRQSPLNKLTPHVSSKMARNAALIGAMVLAPMAGLFSHMKKSPDFLEVACAPDSRLSAGFEKAGYVSKRINYREGFDLESTTGTKMFQHEMKLNTPRLVWVSLPCTRLSPLVNLTARDEDQWAVFEKRQSRDLKRADEVSEGIVEVLDRDIDFAWEWPTNATKGWQSKAIKRILRRMKQLGRHTYWCKFHGCAYGLHFNGVPIMKHWTVLTSSHALWLSLQRTCPDTLNMPSAGAR